MKAQKVDGLCRLFHVRTQIIGYMYICFQTIGDSTFYNQGNRGYKLVSMYKKYRKYYCSCILNCNGLIYCNNCKTCAKKQGKLSFLEDKLQEMTIVHENSLAFEILK